MSKTVTVSEIQNVQVKKKRSRYMRDGFEPIQNGFVHSIPTEIPYGFNYALGYCVETEDMAVNKKNKAMF